MACGGLVYMTLETHVADVPDNWIGIREHLWYGFVILQSGAEASLQVT
jgi:hypothetical protein